MKWFLNRSLLRTSRTKRHEEQEEEQEQQLRTSAVSSCTVAAEKKGLVQREQQKMHPARTEVTKCAIWTCPQNRTQALLDMAIPNDAKELYGNNWPRDGVRVKESVQKLLLEGGSTRAMSEQKAAELLHAWVHSWRSDSRASGSSRKPLLLVMNNAMQVDRRWGVVALAHELGRELLLLDTEDLGQKSVASINTTAVARLDAQGRPMERVVVFADADRHKGLMAASQQQRLLELERGAPVVYLCEASRLRKLGESVTKRAMCVHEYDYKDCALRFVLRALDALGRRKQLCGLANGGCETVGCAAICRFVERLEPRVRWRLVSIAVSAAQEQTIPSLRKLSYLLFGFGNSLSLGIDDQKSLHDFVTNTYEQPGLAGSGHAKKAATQKQSKNDGCFFEIIDPHRANLIIREILNIQAPHRPALFDCTPAMAYINDASNVEKRSSSEARAAIKEVVRNFSASSGQDGKISRVAETSEADSASQNALFPLHKVLSSESVFDKLRWMLTPSPPRPAGREIELVLASTDSLHSEDLHSVLGLLHRNHLLFAESKRDDSQEKIERAARITELFSQFDAPSFDSHSVCQKLKSLCAAQVTSVIKHEYYEPLFTSAPGAVALPSGFDFGGSKSPSGKAAQKNEQLRTALKLCTKDFVRCGAPQGTNLITFAVRQLDEIAVAVNASVALRRRVRIQLAWLQLFLCVSAAFLACVLLLSASQELIRITFDGKPSTQKNERRRIERYRAVAPSDACLTKPPFAQQRKLDIHVAVHDKALALGTFALSCTEQPFDDKPGSRMPLSPWLGFVKRPQLVDQKLWRKMGCLLLPELQEAWYENFGVSSQPKLPAKGQKKPHKGKNKAASGCDKTSEARASASTEALLQRAQGSALGNKEACRGIAGLLSASGSTTGLRTKAPLFSGTTRSGGVSNSPGSSSRKHKLAPEGAAYRPTLVTDYFVKRSGIACAGVACSGPSLVLDSSDSTLHADAVLPLNVDGSRGANNDASKYNQNPGNRSLHNQQQQKQHTVECIIIEVSSVDGLYG